jgi:hypothetical protein
MENPLPPPLDGESNAPSMSLAARLMNIFPAPGEVFEEVGRSKPSILNWLVPVALSCVAAVISVFIIFSQPAVQQQMREQQEQQLEKMVASGKMKAEDKEKAQATMESVGLSIAKIAGAVGAVVGSFVWLLIIAAVLRILGKVVFHAQFSFAKALEVAGLSTMITLLGAIVQTLLVLVKGNMLVSLGPTLYIGEIDPSNKIHLLLSSLNVTTLWYVGVLAVGLAMVSRGSTGKAALWLFSLWAVLRLGFVFAGLARSGM